MTLLISQQTGASIRQVCQTLEAPRSSVYHAAEPTPTQQTDRILGALILTIFDFHKQRYGARRIWEQLSDNDVVCAISRVRRIMKELGLRAIQPKNFVPKTSDGRADKPSPNLLAGQPLPEKPNQVWAGDITFIPVGSRWCYLAVVIDLCSRRIVGWALADHMRSDLVIKALREAIQTRRKTRGTIFHSDRGSQYGSGPFRELLESAGIQQSMSARANPYDNAWTESFIGTLKREVPELLHCEDISDVRITLFEYIEAYYLNHRKHSAIGYMTPSQFENTISKSQ